MRRYLAALLVSLLLVPAAMAGCKSATEPSFDDQFQPWVGTWVGTDSRLQINLQIRRGAPYQSCMFYSCGEYSDLYITANLSDATIGYSATGESRVRTADILGTPAEIEFTLLDREVLGTPGIGRVSYTYRGALQGSQQTTGNVVVSLFKSSVGAAPFSTETVAVTLRKQ